MRYSALLTATIVTAAAAAPIAVQTDSNFMPLAKKKADAPPVVPLTGEGRGAGGAAGGNGGISSGGLAYGGSLTPLGLTLGSIGAGSSLNTGVFNWGGKGKSGGIVATNGGIDEKGGRGKYGGVGSGGIATQGGEISNAIVGPYGAFWGGVIGGAAEYGGGFMGGGKAKGGFGPSPPGAGAGVAGGFALPNSPAIGEFLSMLPKPAPGSKPTFKLPDFSGLLSMIPKDSTGKPDWGAITKLIPKPAQVGAAPPIAAPIGPAPPIPAPIGAAPPIPAPVSVAPAASYQPAPIPSVTSSTDSSAPPSSTGVSVPPPLAPPAVASSSAFAPVLDTVAQPVISPTADAITQPLASA